MINVNIFEIRVGLTLNTGSYESERIDLAATVPDDVKVEDIVQHLRATIMKCSTKGAKLESEVVTVKEVEVGAPAEEAPAEEAPVEEKVKAKRGPKPKGEKVEKADKTSGASKAPAPSKNVPYDRLNDIHKNILGTTFDGINKDWRKPPVKDKAVLASKELVGVDFLDASGAVLQSFKDQLIERLK